MASSSSAKKVARVAASSGGGSKPSKAATWLFPLVVVAIVASGIGILAYARAERGGGLDNSEAPRAQLSADSSAFDHWHASFAISICGDELPPPGDDGPDTLGIHTHDDGLIHIHPFATRASGSRATMSRFFDQVGLEATDDSFRLPPSIEYPEGDLFRAGDPDGDEDVTTCGGEPTELVVAHWVDALTSADTEPDEIFTEDFGSIPFTEDLGAYTLALRPVGSTEVPAPSSSADIIRLGQLDGGSTAADAPAPAEEAPAEEVPVEVPPADLDSPEAPEAGSETTVASE